MFRAPFAPGLINPSGAFSESLLVDSGDFSRESKNLTPLTTKPVHRWLLVYDRSCSATVEQFLRVTESYLRNSTLTEILQECLPCLVLASPISFNLALGLSIYRCLSVTSESLTSLNFDGNYSKMFETVGIGRSLLPNNCSYTMCHPQMAQLELFFSSFIVSGSFSNYLLPFAREKRV